MQISMKCSVAVHCLIFIYEARGIAKVTSSLLAESTGCNPVVIRNIMSALKKAGLITVPRGIGGAQLSADPAQITLYQIYGRAGAGWGCLPDRDPSLPGQGVSRGTEHPQGIAGALPSNRGCGPANHGRASPCNP